MDDTLGQILLGLLTNAISAVFERKWDSLGEADDQLAAAISSVTDGLADDPVLDDAAHGPAIRGFLTSPEVNALIRSLYVAEVHRDADASLDVRAAFAQAFRLQLPDVDSTYADRLFTILTKATGRVVEAAMRTGNAWATRALASSTTRSVKEELAGIKAMLTELLSVDEPDVATFERWEALYRSQAVVRHGTIMPPNTDGALRVPIGDLYVSSLFGRNQDELWRFRRELTEDDLVRNLDRMVVLGDPGAGKSTFAEKLVHDLASGRARLQGRAPTPFFVTLRDYGVERRRSQISMVDWIERTVNADYHAKAPDGAIPYLLNSGRAMVVFDGLDELVDTTQRGAVSKDVETFAARYFAAPVLVTSRRVGYAQAPLDGRRFQRLYLAELGDDQIEQYVQSWFALRSELPDARRRSLAEEFLADSADDAADLRSNTLMLGLLCNIFLRRGSIPPSRPAIYETCAVMLFEQWDRGRRIESALSFEQDLRPVIQHLAYWIYSGQPDGRVDEAAILRRIEAFLLGRTCDDEDEARQRARQLLDVCRGRAWVFTDVGTDPDGERLYQFTHRTFLEFFAAEHLVRTNRTPEQLGRVLRPHIVRGEWDVVAQLAFQLQDKAQADAADELLRDLLVDPYRPRDLALSFGARSLGFLRPSRDSCAVIARTVTARTCTKEGIAREVGAQRFVDPDASERYDKTHRHLVDTATANVKPVARGLVDAALEFVGTAERFALIDRLHVFLDVVMHADLALGERHRAERMAVWDEARLRGFEALSPLLLSAAPEDEYVAQDAFLIARYTVEDLVRAHKIESLFARRLIPLYGQGARRGPIDLLLEGQLQGATRPGRAPLGRADELARFGALLRDSPVPWDPGLSALHASWRARPRQWLRAPADEHLEGDALFGAFAAVAVMVEYALSERRPDPQLFEDLEQRGGWLDLLRPALRARRGQASGSALDVSRLPMDDDACERVMSWALHEWSAVRLRP